MRHQAKNLVLKGVQLSAISLMVACSVSISPRSPSSPLGVKGATADAKAPGQDADAAVKSTPQDSESLKPQASPSPTAASNLGSEDACALAASGAKVSVADASACMFTYTCSYTDAAATVSSAGPCSREQVIEDLYTKACALHVSIDKSKIICEEVANIGQTLGPSVSPSPTPDSCDKAPIDAALTPEDTLCCVDGKWKAVLNKSFGGPGC